MFNQLQNDTYNSLRMNMGSLEGQMNNVNMGMASSYKTTHTTFHETLDGQLKKVTTNNFRTGFPERTYRELDFAIQGPGFFEVTLPDNTVAYTRMGSFHINAEGMLVDENGYRVSTTASAKEITDVDQEGVFSLGLKKASPLIPAGVSLDVSAEGEIYDTRGKDLGKLKLVTFPNLNGLRNVGGNLYLPTREAGYSEEVAMGAMRGETQILQGYLEASNSSVVEGMSKILELNTAIKMQMKIYKTLDQMHGDLNSTISRNL